MAKSLLDQAQICMDSFYQSFRPSTAFFGIEDFAMRIADCRDGELEREFLIQYQKNPLSFPIVNPQWLKRVKVDVKKNDEGEFYAEICEPIVEFPFDDRGAGIQDINPFGQSCGEFVRITNDQVWQICMLPPSNTNFYAIEKCKIFLYNFFGCATALNVMIVPSQSGLPFEQQTVPDGKAESIREVVLNGMFRDYQVKLGKISVHGDGNPNPNPNESSMVYSDLKTK